jgi:hypothetical protein
MYLIENKEQLVRQIYKKILKKKISMKTIIKYLQKNS